MELVDQPSIELVHGSNRNLFLHLGDFDGELPHTLWETRGLFDEEWSEISNGKNRFVMDVDEFPPNVVIRVTIFGLLNNYAYFGPIDKKIPPSNSADRNQMQGILDALQDTYSKFAKVNDIEAKMKKLDTQMKKIQLESAALRRREIEFAKNYELPGLISQNEKVLEKANTAVAKQKKERELLDKKLGEIREMDANLSIQKTEFEAKVEKYDMKKRISDWERHLAELKDVLVKLKRTIGVDFPLETALDMKYVKALANEANSARMRMIGEKSINQTKADICDCCGVRRDYCKG